MIEPFDDAAYLGSLSWAKNWAGKWSLLECCYFGRQYTSLLRQRWGVGLDCVAFVFEDGRSSNYIIAEKADRFAQKMASFAQSYDQAIEELCSDVTRLTDQILSFLKTAPISEESYVRLWSLLDEFLPANFPIKKVADGLSQKALEAALPLLEKVRTSSEPVYAESMAFVVEFARLIGGRASLPEELVLCLRRSELDAFLRSGILPKKHVLEARVGASVLVVNEKNEYVLTGVEAKTFIGALEKGAQSNEVRGSGAFAGKVTGTVRVVLDPEIVKQLPEGSVLVTGMTRPEYAHLFRQAAAVVTDAGGVMCHAAITARELGKVCVVGTQVATKTFKDGDMVEVDAEKGVVKKV